VRFRSFLLSLLLVLLVLAGLAAGGVVWALRDSPLELSDGGAERHPEAATFVPAQSPLMASLVVEVDRLAAYRQLLAPVLGRARAQREITRLQRNLLDPLQLDYERDVRPWLGSEVTFALTDLDYDRDPENGAQPGYLLIAATEDDARSRQFLQEFYSRQVAAGTSDLVFEPYKGTNTIYRRPVAGRDDALASAAIGQFVLFANHPNVLREAITTAQVETLSLRGSPPYQKALPTLSVPRVGEVFANLPAIAAWLADKPTLAPARSNQSFTLALSLAPRGLRADLAVLGVGSGGDRPAAASAEALDYVPAGSSFALAGTDLLGLWEGLRANFPESTPVGQLLAQARQYSRDRLGIDVADAVFPWVRGNYALAAVPTSTGPQWLFAAETPNANARTEAAAGARAASEAKSDTPAEARAETGDRALPESAIAGAALRQLDRLVEAGGWNVGTVSLDNRDITAWTRFAATPASSPSGLRLETTVKGVRATADDYTVLASSLEAIAPASNASQSLVQSERFRSLAEELPQPNDGYVYLDWRASRQQLERQFLLLRAAELAAKPLFDRLSAVALSSRGSREGVRQATVSLQLDAIE